MNTQYYSNPNISKNITNPNIISNVSNPGMIGNVPNINKSKPLSTSSPTNFTNPNIINNVSNSITDYDRKNISSITEFNNKYKDTLTWSLMSLYFQILMIFAKYGIDRTTTFFNLDPNVGIDDTFKIMTTNISQFKSLLKSPESKQLMSELSDILTLSIKELDKPINELTNIVNNLIDKEITVGQQLVFNEIKIALGPVGAAIEIINDVINATANVTEATAEATGIFKNEVEKYNEIMDKIKLWVEKAKIASNSYQDYQNSRGPGSIMKGVNAAKSAYDLKNTTNEINNNVSNYTSNMNNDLSTPRFKNSTVTPITGGKKASDDLKNIQRGGRQSAKRTKKSINDFLSSGIKSSQIIKMINGKSNGKGKQKRYTKRIRY